MTTSTPFTAYDATTGEVLFGGHASEPASLVGPGILVHEGEAHEGPGWLDEAMAYHPQPARPSEHHAWSWASKTWTDPRTLSDFKAAKWAQIKRAREAQEFDKFTWDGSDFDSDLTSQSRIQGAAQLATLAMLNSQPFSIDWTLYDNTVRTLDAADMIGVGQALGVHISTLHGLSRAKRDLIEAAATVEDLEAITW